MDHSYERATQLIPALAVLSPLSILVLVTIRTDDASDIIRSAISVVAAAGFHIIAMRLIRDRGNKIQQPLWDSWGGSSTIRKLRWQGQTDVQVSRLHHRMQAMTGILLPSRAEEETDPAAADETYADAVARLREMTRDHDHYPRVFSELVQYSTARNLLGAKPAGITIVTVTVIASAVMVFAGLHEFWDVPWWLPLSAGLTAVLIGAVWVALVTPRYVLTASERYSDALLAVPNRPDAAD